MAGNRGAVDPRRFCESFLSIRDKHQRIVPLKFKTAQRMLYEVIREERDAGRPVRLLVLKGRQEGISTASEALMFADTVLRRNVHTVVIAHRSDSTKTLFSMNRLFLESLPKALRPAQRLSNAKEILFENPGRDGRAKGRDPGLRSSIRCTTAGSRGFGRGDSFTNVHMSEVAFWPGDIRAGIVGIMQAVPNDPNTTVIIESTANGYNAFQELWDAAEKGESEWRPVFLPWYLEPDYCNDVPDGTVWTAEEERLKKSYGLSDGQLMWRRWCIRVNCGGDVRKFRQEYPLTPDEAFLMTGESFFDNDLLIRLRRAARPPLRTGAFHGTEPDEGAAPVGWTMREDERGCVRIWKTPEDGVPYVIGGDTAGEGSDCFTAFVLDNRTGEQVAELQLPMSEIGYARQLYCLGRYYNDALLAVEVNFSTYPEMKLEEWHYPNLYQRERFDTFANQYVRSFGWMTSQKTRGAALGNLYTAVTETPENFRSAWTLGEMMTFVYDRNRKPQAAQGKHDDLVMAAAVCHMARSQQRYTRDERKAFGGAWTRDQWEDYFGAPEEEKERLRRKWG